MDTIATNYQEYACPRCGSDEFDYIIIEQLDEGDVRLQCSCRGDCKEGERSFFLRLTPAFASRVLEQDEIARETAEPPFSLPT